MADIDELRVREPGTVERQDARPGNAGTGGTAPPERKWPVSLSMLIAVVVSVILWAGIIMSAIRLWRWL